MAKDPNKCNHKNSYHFHNNAPAYCPDCDSYVDGDRVVSVKSKK